MLDIINKMELFWQYPVITEKTFYLQNYKDENYLPFPWATVLDKYINLDTLYLELKSQINQSEYYTCCQHIHFRKLIPLFKKLGVKTIYSPHKVKDEDYIDEIQIICCPHYAINVEDNTRSLIDEKEDLMVIPRKYKYSFMGAYQKHYITNIREKIFKLANTRDDIYIQNTGQWHFQSDVYNSSQNMTGSLNENSDHKNKTLLFCQIMLQSRFSLCPVGSGPGTIRFWESLGYGSIPVLLADCYDLPKHKLWNDSIVIIKENQLDKLDEILDNISIEKENKMRKNCLDIYKYFKNKYKCVLPQSTKLKIYMPDSIQKFFEGVLKSTTNYLEFGGGGTTELASKYIKGKGYLITSIKYLPNKLSDIISDNISIHYIDVESDDDFGNPYSKCHVNKVIKYTSIINLVDINSIDTILVKGRFRVGCLLSIFDYIKDTTIILVDDYRDRKHYHVLEKYYDIVDRIDRMIIFKKKSKVDTRKEIKRYILDPR